MYLVDVSIFPVSEGVSLSKYVRAAYSVIEKSGLKHRLTPMGTIIEGPDMDELFSVISRAEKAVLDAGARRVVLYVKVDHRVDKEYHMEDKVRSVIGE